MRASNVILVLGFLIVCYLGYKAAVSIPDQYVNDAQTLAKSIDRQKANIVLKRTSLESLKNSDNWPFLEPYSTKEQWPIFFEASENSLDSATKNYIETIEPILKRDHEDDVTALVSAIGLARTDIQSSIKDANYHDDRAKFIVDGRDNEDDYFKNASKLQSDIDQRSIHFTTIAADKQEKYPAKFDDIEAKVSVTRVNLGAMQSLFSAMKGEYESDTTNYAIFSDSYRAIQESHKLSLSYLDSTLALLAQLDRSYVKVLADQNIDYFITLRRANWCEGEYCGEGSSTRYPAARVDENTFDYFENLTIGTIATRGTKWGSSQFRLSIPQSRWDALKVSPEYRWTRGEPYAEYWVDNTTAKTLHKYTVIENGSVVEEDWVTISNELFWKHQGHLGMAIATKPLGVYESDTVNSAEPVGMAMIAAPTMVNGIPTGTNEYGEWRNSNGNSFWHYYGMYHMFGSFMRPGRYSYNSWHGYNSRSRNTAYYGRNSEYGTYGRSTYSNSKYKNSSFAKRNPGDVTSASTGRPSKTQSSLRGAGAAGRGKGPSGGGK